MDSHLDPLAGYEALFPDPDEYEPECPTCGMVLCDSCGTCHTCASAREPESPVDNE